MSPRPRKRILTNLETVFREAYDAAREDGDERRMRDLDSSFQREQLLLEALLDIRDALYQASETKSTKSAIEKLSVLKKLTKFK